jgi:MoaA/NifB/PqqE/SkfB family radical SAM enzyme
MRPLSILWRGPLDSCNYGCRYCPFAKRKARRAVLDHDRAALARFVAWASVGPWPPLAVLFTPWGEALIHAWYREALIALSRLERVQQVAIQTNGSGSWAWLAAAERSKLAFWITWHPSEVTLERFLGRLRPLVDQGVSFSVGAVGVREHLPMLEELRARLPAQVTTWINAHKPYTRYTAEEHARLTAIDPRFELTLRPHPSRGRACRTGEEVVSIDGEGDIRRCHFVDDVLGNLYHDDLMDVLRPRACPRARCDCYVGFAHLDHLGLREVLGDGLLARMLPIGRQ